jgi:hypothetical protein
VEQVLGQQVIAHSTVVALNIGVLLWVAGLDKDQCNTLFFSPSSQCGTDVFRAIVTADLDGLSPPLDDLIQGPDNTLVVSGITFNVAQIEKTQVETPVALVVGQAHQQISDLGVLTAEPGLISIAGLTDTETTQA